MDRFAHVLPGILRPRRRPLRCCSLAGRAVAGLLLGLVTGCTVGPGTPQAGLEPQAVWPATRSTEQERFDLYPDPDLGPAVMGGRPRDFDKPRAEPTRARWTQPLSGR